MSPKLPNSKAKGSQTQKENKKISGQNTSPAGSYVPVYNLDSSPELEGHPLNGHARVKAVFVRFGGFLRKTHKKIMSAIRKKKEEPLTLMFIPHNENKIKNYNFSNLTLTIFLGVFSICLIVGAILIINYTGTVQEVGKLKKSQKDSKIQFAKIRDEIKDISLSYEEIKNILSGVVKLTGGKESVKDIYYGLGGAAIPLSKLKGEQKRTLLGRTLGLDESPADKTDTLSKEQTIPMEIFILNRITSDMDIIAHELDYVDDHVKRNLKSIRNSPTLWPTNGYIANPFGFVRRADDLKATFNSGFDIVAHPGAKVVVTAPGSVDSVTRDKNGLLSVRVKHHYSYQTVYHGLASLTVGINTSLAKGDTIGYMGMVSGPGQNVLHYEVYIGTEAQNPATYLYTPKE